MLLKAITQFESKISGFSHAISDLNNIMKKYIQFQSPVPENDRVQTQMVTSLPSLNMHLFILLIQQTNIFVHLRNVNYNGNEFVWF